MRLRPLGVSALGLEPGASRGDITRAYRRLARLMHPDMSGDPAAAQRFASLTDAYHRALAEAEAVAARPVRSTPRPSFRTNGGQFVAGPVHVTPQPFGPRRES